MAVYVGVATLTKAELVKLLESLPDDAKAYVMATRETVRMALAGANVGPGDAYFGLSSNSTRELDGIAIAADYQPDRSKSES